jgi:hypothetical protein
MITKEKHRIRCESFTEGESFTMMELPGARGGGESVIGARGRFSS